MKASSNAAILQTFLKAGLHIDASSLNEVSRVRRAAVVFVVGQEGLGRGK